MTVVSNNDKVRAEPQDELLLSVEPEARTAADVRLVDVHGLQGGGQKCLGDARVRRGGELGVPLDDPLRGLARH